MVQVITDSCASIPDKLVKQLGIEVVPYYIHRGVETLRDLVDVKRKEFFEWLPKAERLPQTANPGPGDYLVAFRKAAEKAKEVVTVHMTSKGSGAYQSALAAKDMARELLPDLKIEVVDTLQVAMVHGWAAIEAARGALQGLALGEVARVAREVADKGMMIQTADTLRYLYMGGRIGKAQHLAGSLLKIKPLIGMKDGIIVALGQVRSRTRAYLEMVNLIQQRLAPGDRIKAAFTHAAAPEEAERLRDLVTGHFDCAETLIAELSPALGVHTGPGTVGVCFYVT
jgi:DegV family protein with EDD domain